VLFLAVSGDGCGAAELMFLILNLIKVMYKLHMESVSTIPYWLLIVN
jgi:hypothetical protein